MVDDKDTKLNKKVTAKEAKEAYLSGDEATFNEFYLNNEKLIKFSVHKYYYIVKDFMAFEDANSVALQAFLNALKFYDESKGQFSTFLSLNVKFCFSHERTTANAIKRFSDKNHLSLDAEITSHSHKQEEGSTLASLIADDNAINPEIDVMENDLINSKVLKVKRFLSDEEFELFKKIFVEEKKLSEIISRNENSQYVTLQVKYKIMQKKVKTIFALGKITNKAELKNYVNEFGFDKETLLEYYAIGRYIMQEINLPIVILYKHASEKERQMILNKFMRDCVGVKKDARERIIAVSQIFSNENLSQLFLERYKFENTYNLLDNLNIFNTKKVNNLEYEMFKELHTALKIQQSIMKGDKLDAVANRYNLSIETTEKINKMLSYATGYKRKFADLNIDFPVLDNNYLLLTAIQNKQKLKKLTNFLKPEHINFLKAKYIDYPHMSYDKIALKTNQTVEQIKNIEVTLKTKLNSMFDVYNAVIENNFNFDNVAKKLNTSVKIVQRKFDFCDSVLNNNYADDFSLLNVNDSVIRERRTRNFISKLSFNTDMNINEKSERITPLLTENQTKVFTEFYSNKLSILETAEKLKLNKSKVREEIYLVLNKLNLANKVYCYNTIDKNDFLSECFVERLSDKQKDYYLNVARYLFENAPIPTKALTYAATEKDRPKIYRELLINKYDLNLGDKTVIEKLGNIFNRNECEIIKLRFCDNHTINQIAEELNITKKMVHHQLFQTEKLLNNTKTFYKEFDYGKEDELAAKYGMRPEWVVKYHLYGKLFYENVNLLEQNDYDKFRLMHFSEKQLSEIQIREVMNKTLTQAHCLLMDNLLFKQLPLEKVKEQLIPYKYKTDEVSIFANKRRGMAALKNALAPSPKNPTLTTDSIDLEL